MPTGPDPLASVEYWEARLGPTHPGDGQTWPYERCVGHLLPRAPGSTCLEVGFFPGGHLLFLARHYDYRITGIDFSPRVQDVAPAFSAHGIEANLVQADFFTWAPSEQFDVVCSFGFVQFFGNFRLAIARHWDLVKPGGTLLMTVPALTPFQWLLRRATYQPAKFCRIVRAHNPAVMRLSVLRHEVERCAGARIVSAKYIREMTVWFEGRDPEMQPWAPAVLAAVRPFVRAARRLRISSRWFSPEILVLARKNSTSTAPLERWGRGPSGPRHQ